MDRRRFLELAGGTALTVCLGGCASLATTTVRPEGGVVRLALRNHPNLVRPGGSLRVRPEGAATPLYVLALPDGDFAVLSPICTHLRCLVEIEGANLVCPCHGSTFDREGDVLRGPAERPLRRIPARVSGDGDLIIDLRGEA